MHHLSQDDRSHLWQMIGHCIAATESEAPHVASRFLPGAWMVTSDVDSAVGNWFACHHAADGLEDSLGTIFAYLAAQGRPASGWISQSVLDEAAAVAGRFPITKVRESPLMSRMGRPVPGGTHPFQGRVQRLATADALERAFPIMASAFHLDPGIVRTIYRGLLVDPRMSVHLAGSDQPASVCISWRSGTDCYIFGMSTAPDHQRQGAGRAVLTAVMDEAVNDGCERFYLTSSAAGEALYRSMGFETIEMTERWNFIPSATQSTSEGPG